MQHHNCTVMFTGRGRLAAQCCQPVVFITQTGLNLGTQLISEQSQSQPDSEAGVSVCKVPGINSITQIQQLNLKDDPKWADYELMLSRFINPVKNWQRFTKKKKSITILIMRNVQLSLPGISESFIFIPLLLTYSNFIEPPL